MAHHKKKTAPAKARAFADGSRAIRGRKTLVKLFATIPAVKTEFTAASAKSAHACKIAFEKSAAITTVQLKESQRQGLQRRHLTFT
ncbi:MAG: hypothetical protein LBM04_09850 [Opitutaceae bacterium]|jgi:hypothetical protein|nr:hypothetical protein [Opitutaceae bacterium]